MALRLGEIAVSKGLITEAQLQEALAEQKKSSKFLGEIFVDLGFTTEDNLLTVLAEQFNTKFLDLNNVNVSPAVIELVPRALAWEYKFMPLQMKSAIMLIAVSNPLDMWPMSALKDKVGLAEVQIVLAKKDNIEEALLKYYGAEVRGDDGRAS